MAAINDLIAQVTDVSLREKLEREVNKLSKQKKFGLVFESHLPEVTPLYEMPVKLGCKVILKDRKVDKNIYTVIKVDSNIADCVSINEKEPISFDVDDLVRVAEFGEPIYPYLKLMDSVCNAPDSNLWHTLIEADNYHALQLLEYMYAGKVDCIYINPPYNTGARDWKYNNDYVDSNDLYRHSKWLSFMEKRLRIAKKLLNPKNSMLMITIDDIELCSLRLLIDELFQECAVQIVDMVINPKGKARVGKLSQVDEYLVLIYMGDAKTCPEKSNDQDEEIRWPYLRRSDVESARGTTKGGTKQFYPIYVDVTTDKIVKIGEPLLPEQPLSDAETIEGAVAVFPIREDGKQMNWGLTGESLQYALDNKCVRVSKSNNPNQAYNFAYVTMPSIKKVLDGEYHIAGVREDGTNIITLPNGTEHQKPTAWKETHYDANVYGTQLIGSMLGEKRFSFPKSVYSVLDALNIFLEDKKDGLIVDFFAGSGTTLHATNLLNKKDNGNRRCIMVTNNEVSEKEAEELSKKGLKPGDSEWEKYGIAEYVTWPRTVCSIKGTTLKGTSIKGNYNVTREEFVNEKAVNIIDDNGNVKPKNVYVKKKIPVYPEFENFNMADGFKSNAVFLKLGFLDKTAVALGMQFRELLPVLWMKSGAIGKCPEIESKSIPSMLILPQNNFAVLIDENCFAEFEIQLKNNPDIQTVYIVTDYEVNYRSMVRSLNVKETYQLYRDYLDNFRINHGRD